ncbi:uncharacterized protein BT62DRAFT_1010214 [Guyanagaster necrorhizus]|uniref:Uncharacterized protein n=1 Tax=Guyanagaster necrorhizus TaxID=856835 RepID=A0A9P7VLC9_9AGAR|nr:uncharacterized protein BT62DRAFT_1010214 [Guyanagaster necrorhizus MCA 3950]KAG7442602.1 hypothetical protein BT62DRAFT_1010214 [Guyanagaster necrorhizus MCA 3950]
MSSLAWCQVSLGPGFMWYRPSEHLSRLPPLRPHVSSLWHWTCHDSASVLLGKVLRLQHSVRMHIPSKESSTLKRVKIAKLTYGWSHILPLTGPDFTSRGRRRVSLFPIIGGASMEPRAAFFPTIMLLRVADVVKWRGRHYMKHRDGNRRDPLSQRTRSLNKREKKGHLILPYRPRSNKRRVMSKFVFMRREEETKDGLDISKEMIIARRWKEMSEFPVQIISSLANTASEYTFQLGSSNLAIPTPENRSAQG